jgi:hypothetical protein
MAATLVVGLQLPKLPGMVGVARRRVDVITLGEKGFGETEAKAAVGASDKDIPGHKRLLRVDLRVTSYHDSRILATVPS